MRRSCGLAVSMALVLAACGGEPPPPIARETAVAERTDDLAEAHHLVYLHGRIIENQGRRPTHPTWGVYEYDETIRAFADRGFEVHSEVRSGSTDVHAYAERVVTEIEELVSSGVPPANITVVGFSKGGAIAIHVAWLLGRNDVNFVLLAACGPWIERMPDLVPKGRILSIRESSDDLVGACTTLFDRTEPPTTHEEIVIEIGGGHGAFYRPRPEWLDPLADFARSAP